MADRERLQAEKMSVEARMREVEEWSREEDELIRTVKESLEEQQHQAGSTLSVCAGSKL